MSARHASRIDAAGERLRRVLDGPASLVERHATLLFFAFSVVYLALARFFAARKLLWNDELYSYYVATQPTMRDVWGALSAGGEQTPPLFYAVTRASFAAFGATNLSIRLPEMIGFWVMSGCLFMFVRRRASNTAALVAAVIPFVTSAFPYAYEARPYAMVLGFVALALLAWQSIVIGRRRTAWFACLIVSLAATVSSHYYGVFVLVPIALGEMIRSLDRRRIDPAIWLALLIAVVPLAFHIPLLRAGAAYSGTFWSPPQWVNLPDFYEDLLRPGLVPLVGVLVVGFVVRDWPRAASPVVRTAPSRGELAAAIGFVLVPAVALLAAKIATGAFVNRYALSAVIGFAILGGLGADHAFRQRRAMLALVLAAVAVWFALSQAREVIAPTGVSQPVGAASVQRPAEWLAEAGEPALPVVIADPHNFAVLSHYGEPSIRQRIVYVADPARALKQLGHNSVERGMLDLLGPWFHMNVVPFDEFLPSHPRFFVYGDFVRLGFLNWLLPELHASGFRTELLNRAGDNMLLYAEQSDGRGTTSPVRGR